MNSSNGSDNFLNAISALTGTSLPDFTGNMYGDGGTMIRVKRSNGNYAWVRTKDGVHVHPDDVDEYGRYNLYDESGKNVVGRAYGNSFNPNDPSFDADEERIRQYLGGEGVTIYPTGQEPKDTTPEELVQMEKAARQQQRNKEIARNREIDKKVRQYAFTPEGFFGVATQPMNLLSPTNVGRGIYNSITGNGYGNIVQDLLLPNNGVFSDEFAAEHPYLTMAGNMGMDALTLGAGRFATKLPKYRVAMQAEERATQDALVSNWDDMINRGNRRLKVGDAELNNPELYYRQSAKGTAENFIENNSQFTPLEEYWAAIDEAGGEVPAKIRSGVEPGLSLAYPNAMYAQGHLWFKHNPEKYPSLLVTAEQLPVANMHASPLKPTASLPLLYKQGSRRVTVSGPDGQLNPSNTSAYKWEPGYGWRRVGVQETPTLSWEDANNNPTENLLKWLGKPLSYKPDISLLDDGGKAGLRGSAEEKLMNLFDLKGIDLSRLSKEDLTEALQLRENEIKATAPERYTYAEATGSSPEFLLKDMLGDNVVGKTQIGRRWQDGRRYINNTNNKSGGEVGQVYERGLNSAIDVDKSLGGDGIVSGANLRSAPKQYHVLQKFRDREVLDNTGQHLNVNMVESGPVAGTEVKSILELARAGGKYSAFLENAPVWKLKTPTFHVPTKSNLFDPSIINSEGRMYIDWLNPNILKGLAIPATVGSLPLANNK